MAERSGNGAPMRATNGKAAARRTGLLHHGTRLALLFGVAFLIHLLFPVAPVPDFPELEEGMVAQEDIIARVGFPIYKADEGLAREREEAASAVAPIFDYEPAAVDTMLARIDALMERLDAAASASRALAPTRVAEVLQAYTLQTSDALISELLDDGNREQLRRALEEAVREDLPRGVAASGDLRGNPAQIRVRRAGGDRILPRDSVATGQVFFSGAPERRLRNNPELAELHRLALTRLFSPSLRLNAGATEAARERARRAVAPIKADVVQGEKIVGANERIREAELERLQAYREHLGRMGAMGTGEWNSLRTLGAWAMNAMLLLIFGLVTFFYRRNVYDELRHVLLLLGLSLGLLAAAAIIARFEVPPQLVPIAVPVMVVAALWDARMALTYSLVLAILVAAQAPFGGISLLFTFVVGGAAAAFAVRAVRRRAETWRFASIIAVSYAAAVLTLGLLRQWDGEQILWSVGWVTLNAIASALLAMGFLPLFESFARITTDQTLLELADLNRPLLQRLSREAPGTFAHTINVANLAEAAARAAGANSLLARVGVYYHDVGKIAKPLYFIENQPQGRNPHDKLKPGTSASVIRHHVSEGVRLADEYKLPQSIKAFIAEHHGTQPIGFFLERARENDPSAEVDPREYAYPGPKPQSAETAIAMLADSVESAARVLKDPTPDRIASLVDRIVENKMQLGQLDDAPITLRELRAMKEAFSMVLTGMYHHRIDYPSQREPEPSDPAPPTAAPAARS